jgi:hypothetical protein
MFFYYNLILKKLIIICILQFNPFYIIKLTIHLIRFIKTQKFFKYRMITKKEKKSE